MMEVWFEQMAKDYDVSIEVVKRIYKKYPDNGV